MTFETSLPNSIAHYRQLAFAALEEAQRMPESERRQSCLRMAESWAEIARETEQYGAETGLLRRDG